MVWHPLHKGASNPPLLVRIGSTGQHKKWSLPGLFVAGKSSIVGNGRVTVPSWPGTGKSFQVPVLKFSSTLIYVRQIIFWKSSSVGRPKKGQIFAVHFPVVNLRPGK